jgi:hypothetical protein
MHILYKPSYFNVDIALLFVRAVIHMQTGCSYQISNVFLCIKAEHKDDRHLSYCIELSLILNYILLVLYLY